MKADRNSNSHIVNRVSLQTWPGGFLLQSHLSGAGIVWKHCFAYIDDVLVCSRTFDNHLSHLEQVFARLQQARLKLKPRKCLFLREEVPYLGYIVTRDCNKPDPAKTDKIQHYSIPTDVTKVCKFLALASHYRRFVPGFAKEASPLHALLKKEAVFCGMDLPQV